VAPSEPTRDSRSRVRRFCRWTARWTMGGRSGWESQSSWRTRGTGQLERFPAYADLPMDHA
jgi:hypothetical protein